MSFQQPQFQQPQFQPQFQQPPQFQFQPQFQHSANQLSQLNALRNVQKKGMSPAMIGIIVFVVLVILGCIGGLIYWLATKDDDSTTTGGTTTGGTTTGGTTSGGTTTGGTTSGGTTTGGTPVKAPPLNTTTPGCAPLPNPKTEFGACVEQNDGSWTKTRRVNSQRDLEDTSICNEYKDELELCPEEPCVYTIGDFSNCSADGKSSSRISVTKLAKYGAVCAYTDGQLLPGSCEKQDCKYTVSTTNNCTEKDGIYKRWIKYQVTQPALFGGKPCDKTEEQIQANQPVCLPIGCGISEYVKDLTKTHFIHPKDYPLATGKQILGIPMVRKILNHASNGGVECPETLVTEMLDSSMFALGGNSSLFHPFSLEQPQPVNLLLACPSVPMNMTTSQTYLSGSVDVGINEWRNTNSLFGDDSQSVISAWPMRTDNNTDSKSYAEDGYKVQFLPVDKDDVNGIVNLYKIVIYQSTDSEFVNPRYIRAKLNPPETCGGLDLSILGGKGNRLERSNEEGASIFVIVPVRKPGGVEILPDKYYLRVCNSNDGCITYTDTPKQLFIAAHGGGYNFCNFSTIKNKEMNWRNNDYGFVIGDNNSSGEEVVWNISRPGECGEPSV
jgi:hypothetical protein